MPNDAYEYMKMLLNVNKNAKIVIECELHANVRFLARMNASSCYWSSIHTNECVFSRNEQQKVYKNNNIRSMFSYDYFLFYFKTGNHARAVIKRHESYELLQSSCVTVFNQVL